MLVLKKVEKDSVIAVSFTWLRRILHSFFQRNNSLPDLNTKRLVQSRDELRVGDTQRNNRRVRDFEHQTTFVAGHNGGRGGGIKEVRKFTDEGMRFKGEALFETINRCDVGTF